MNGNGIKFNQNKNEKKKKYSVEFVTHTNTETHSDPVYLRRFGLLTKLIRVNFRNAGRCFSYIVLYRFVFNCHILCRDFCWLTCCFSQCVWIFIIVNCQSHTHTYTHGWTDEARRKVLYGLSCAFSELNEMYFIDVFFFSSR